MRVYVSHERRFFRTPDGATWTTSQAAYPFWRRYLEVFDEVCVIARVADVASPEPAWKRADGPQVHFFPLPYYIGARQYVMAAPRVRAACRKVLQEDGALILRVGSQIAACLLQSLQANRPYALEVVGDPYDVFGRSAIQHPLRPLLRVWFSRQLREQCRFASAVTYVTQSALQRRYPPGNSAFATYYSDVELHDEAFVDQPRYATIASPARTLITVGSMAHRYKATDVLLEAVHLCRNRGLDIRLIIVGDGKHRQEFQQQASELQIGEQVSFLGELPGPAAIRRELDAGDIFVLPSRQEGLPRALIEAMARGLPCIASNVGGIPELLPPEDLVRPNDAVGLADKIVEVARSPARLQTMAARNLDKAREYHDSLLRERRNEFYRQVRRISEAWYSRLAA